MINKILLNDELYQIEEANLPCLITYREKTGGSHFSISLVADLARRGSKILFLTAYPMAKDNFMEQVEGLNLDIVYATNESEVKSDAQVIILESGNEKLFLEVIEKLADIKDRVVLIKNMEVFSQETIEACLLMKKLILSGDVDKSSSKLKISQQKFATTIVFSKPEIEIALETPELDKYIGYLQDENRSGFVKIDFENN